jgi:hypothetical protein
MKKKDLWVIAIILISVRLFSSCSAWEQELGSDLLPPGDKVFLYHDTVFEINAYPVAGLPLITSESPYQPKPSALYLLGGLEDSIVGVSEASMFTQFNPSASFNPGPNTEIDSMMLILYIDDYVGDMSQDFTISVHESTERIYMDSLYYSDYELEGKYNPAVLAEKTITPAENDTVEILIRDQGFIQKFLDVQTDTALFWSDSVFKDYFKGFYISATSNADQGAMARVGLSNIVSRLTFKYANDSTEIDTTSGRDFVWATFRINEFSSQKINVFEHDHSMTYLGEIIDRDSLETPYAYVQGMAGVNTRLSFTGMEKWMGEGKVAINSATLIFDMVPEDISGIPLEETPLRLMLYSELDNGRLEQLYDYYAVSQVDDGLFGGIREEESRGMFHDTTYIYRFNMGLHFQAMVDGVKPDYNFRLQLYDAVRNPKISKLWSNLFTNPKRIRLEVTYLKL